jgi:hypothetical protein
MAVEILCGSRRRLEVPHFNINIPNVVDLVFLPSSFQVESDIVIPDNIYPIATSDILFV